MPRPYAGKPRDRNKRRHCIRLRYFHYYRCPYFRENLMHNSSKLLLPDYFIGLCLMHLRHDGRVTDFICQVLATFCYAFIITRSACRGSVPRRCNELHIDGGIEAVEGWIYEDHQAARSFRFRQSASISPLEKRLTSQSHIATPHH